MTTIRTRADLFSLLLPAKQPEAAQGTVREQEGILLDTRWHAEHKKPSEWRWNDAMGRVICHDCFSGGYPLRPRFPCSVCREDAWYERLPEYGGDWICGCCHPPVERPGVA